MIQSIEDVRARVEDIRSIGSGDPEAAHSEEDKLREEVLVAIARASVDEGARQLAEEALRTNEIRFPRWCA